MSDLNSMDINRNDPDEFKFKRLKSDALRLVQEMSGQNWTDFNLHDPGVTIIDQFCYALTDLVYRTDFPLIDHLVDADGRLDTQHKALHPPEIIFPCRPTTVFDYQQFIFSNVPEIDNVWIRPLEGRESKGLYSIVIRPSDTVAQADVPALLEKVRQIYLNNRNLCEDLEELSVVPEEDCRIQGAVEIGDDRDPAEILADIYHACELKIARGLQLHNFEELRKEELSLEEIFQGPFSSHACKQNEDIDGDGELPRVADLLSAVMQIRGVRHVKYIVLNKTNLDGNTESIETWDMKSSSLRLLTPNRDDALMVRLIRNEKIVPVAIQDFKTRYEELRLRRQALRANLLDTSSLSVPPTGEYRKVDSYYSIQKQFPAIYGINSYGIPGSAPADIKAKTAQLKAFLLFFDQIMANYGANLQNIRHFFSCDTLSNSSYFSTVVENSSFPGLETIYPENPSDAVDTIVREHDPYHERKSRMLDYLIALYGEIFPQDQYKTFNPYVPQYEQNVELVERKAAFLKSIVKLTRDRAEAFNYSLTPSNMDNVSGLKRRLSLQLGFYNILHRPLTVPILRLGLAISETDISGQLMTVDEKRLLFIPCAEHSRSRSSEELRDELVEIIPLENPVLSAELFRTGTNIDSYRVLPDENGNGADLLLMAHHQAGWLKVAAFPDIEKAMRSANTLRRFLVRLNRECEGVHIVEHILLRDRSGLEREINAETLSFRISAVFPAWTTRCSDDGFRQYAEETVRNNCPAHIEPIFHWLDFDKGRRFEKVYKQWLEACSDSDSSVHANEAAKRLLEILSAPLTAQNCGTWP